MISSMVETAESNSNIIYANSGLLTIEDTIKSFVNKYSHYDKCQQARDTLNQLIGITDKEIEEKNQELGSRKVELQNKLDSQKSEILETIDKSISHEREDYTSRYPEEMLSYLQSLTQNLKKERAESLYKDSYERIDLEYPEVIVDDIHSGSDAFSKLKGHIDNYMLGEDRRRKLEEQASTEVLNVIKQEFSENLVMAKEHFNLFSKEFWLNATSDVRKEFEKVISGDLDLQP